MSLNFTVRYAFSLPNADDKPENERWGYGTIPINTDKVPTTDEEKIEVARTVGLQGGYEKVVIIAIDPTNKFTDDSDEVLEGEIVIDGK